MKRLPSLFALCAALFLSGVEVQADMIGYTLRNGAGGENYFLSNQNRADSQMLQLGIQSLHMGNQAYMQRQQHAHEMELLRQRSVIKQYQQFRQKYPDFRLVD